MAGNIVHPNEVEQMLSFVLSDGEYKQLDGWWLLLLRNQRLAQITWLGTLQSKQHAALKYFTGTDGSSTAICDLMSQVGVELATSSSVLARY